MLEIAERLFDLHESQASDLRGSAAHAASVLGRIVVGIYAKEAQDTPFVLAVRRVSDLIWEDSVTGKKD